MNIRVPIRFYLQNITIIKLDSTAIRFTQLKLFFFTAYLNKIKQQARELKRSYENRINEEKNLRIL